MNKNLKKCVEIMKNGGIAIFPTDTAFGIGCRIDDVRAVRRVFKIRKRPQNKPVLVLVSSRKMAEEYVDNFTPEARRLVSKYWPGGLTIIFAANKKTVPKEVRGGGDTIGIRMPAHATILKMISQIGVPVLAPSANFSGGKTPFSFRELDPELIKLVDFTMPGKCKIKEQSTIVETSGKNPKIVRQGAVKIQ